MYLGVPSFRIFFDFTGLGFLLVIVGCFFGIFVYSMRGKPAVMLALLAVMVALGVVRVYRGAMAPAESWMVMLGAIENAPLHERAARVNDLRANWTYREMRSFDWYVLSRKWNVCHELWHEEACTRPAVSTPGVGIAREKLDDIASTQSTYAFETRGYSSLPRYELKSHAPDADHSRHRLEITDLATGTSTIILPFDQSAETRWSPDDRYVAISRNAEVLGSSVVVYAPNTAHVVTIPWPDAVRGMDLEFGRATMRAIGWSAPGELWVDVFAHDGMGKTFHAKVIHRMRVDR